MTHLKSFFRTFEDKSVADAKYSSVDSMICPKDISKDKDSNLQSEKPIQSLAPDSPDVGWYSDNLVICLEPQPSEETNEGIKTPVTSGKPSKTPNVPARKISYHTPKLLIDGHVTDFLKPDSTATARTAGWKTKEAKEFMESKEPSKDCSPGVKTPTNVKETQAGENISSKIHRTPVQKVFPQVKSASPTRKNHISSQSHRQQKGHMSIQPKPSKTKTVQDQVPRQNKELSSLANLVKYHQPQSIAAAAHLPLTVTVATPLIVQNSQPVCVPSPVVSSLAVVPVIPPVLTATPNITITPIPVSVSQSLSVQQSPPVTLCSISDAVNSVLIASSQSNASANVSTVSISDVQSNISNLHNQSLLDISILRSLLLDPPPDGAACTEIHNLILQKAKELDAIEQPQDRDSNLPVITNVVSLNEEVMKKAAESVSNLMNIKPQTSPLPKVLTVPVQEAPLQRSADSPVILEDNVKAIPNMTKNSTSDVTNIIPDPLNDVFRNLQLEIKNLEKMAEEKKKQYFLIMYVRNFKRETLQRLHESFRAKACLSPASKKKSQCPDTNESNSTHLKETCLVRPMVQSQNNPTSLPSSQAHNTSEPPKPANLIDTVKDATLVNLISDSQNKNFHHSPDAYKPPKVENNTSIHSSLAALAKIESEYRAGFRSSYSPSNSMNNSNKETTSTKNCDTNCSTASYNKYKPSKILPKTSPPLPNPHHKATTSATLSPLSTSATPPQLSSIELNNPNLSSWKGPASAYFQKTKASSAKPVPTSNPTVSSPYSNSVKNLLKYSSPTHTNNSIPSLVKDACKNSDHLNSTKPQMGPNQFVAPTFLDLYPFHSMPPCNNYLQSNPFWSSPMSNNKPNSSLNSQQTSRDMYMNSFPFDAWRAAKSLETESERHGEKVPVEKLWNPFSAASHRPYLSSEGQLPSHNLVGHRPFHYGAIHKCVVCKIAQAQFICSGCGKDWYCSVACQRQNWSVHSRSCALPST